MYIEIEGHGVGNRDWLYVVLTGNDSVVQDAPGGSTFQSNVVQWWANGTVLPYPGLCRRWQVVSYLMPGHTRLSGPPVPSQFNYMFYE
jgi:hypothetical protein